MRSIDPLVLVVDLDGRVRDRVVCSDDRVPADLASAASLAAVLSAPVCTAWVELVRDTLARREGLSTMAVIDGRGHAMLVEPADSPEPCALVVVFPTTMCVGGSLALRGPRFVPLLQHEWGRLDCLSRGQLDTLRSVTLGLTNDQIAGRVHRTKRAIEWHIRFLNQLLGTNGREELATIGRRAGLCCLTDEVWQRVLHLRPSRRDTSAPDPMPEPKPLHVA